MMLRTLVILVILVVVGIYAAVHYAQKNAKPDNRPAFAQCLTDKGAKMYGAYWCPHCQAQKKVFGGAFSKVTYVECGIPVDTGGQTQACKDANISSYPTWVFADGTRETGEHTLTQLADKTGCSLDVTPVPQK